MNVISDLIYLVLIYS